MSTKWIEREQYYEYPVPYSTQTKAHKSAQKLSDTLKIFAKTVRRQDEYTNEPYYVVITKNDVPHQ